mmetsp:Transcript_30596/g.84087  ORF Transcript_30596/g.84087 Transcript_30596/m.84087 type:complete len:220 (-) Transcript_30596:58-717(-)
MPVGYRDGPDSHDVARQRQLQRTTGQVPDFDQAIVARRGEPLVRGVHGDGADPTLVAGDHSHELPRRVPHGLWDLRASARRYDLDLFGWVGRRSQRRQGSWSWPPRGGGGCSCACGANDSSANGTEAARTCSKVCEHLRDSCRLGLPGCVFDRGRAEERKCLEGFLAGLVGDLANVLVLVVHLDAQQHLCSGRILRPPDVMVAREHVVRPLQGALDRQR